jgi:hypothetical protein
MKFPVRLHTDTVKTLKRAIFATKNTYKEHKQRIVLRGKCLEEDGATLAACGVVSGDVLVVSLDL